MSRHCFAHGTQHLHRTVMGHKAAKFLVVRDKLATQVENINKGLRNGRSIEEKFDVELLGIGEHAENGSPVYCSRQLQIGR